MDWKLSAWVQTRVWDIGGMKIISSQTCYLPWWVGTTMVAPLELSPGGQIGHLWFGRWVLTFLHGKEHLPAPLCGAEQQGPHWELCPPWVPGQIPCLRSVLSPLDQEFCSGHEVPGTAVSRTQPWSLWLQSRRLASLTLTNIKRSELVPRRGIDSVVNPHPPWRTALAGALSFFLQSIDRGQLFRRKRQMCLAPASSVL